MNKLRAEKKTEPIEGLMSNCLLGTIKNMKDNLDQLSEVLHSHKFEYGSSVLLRSITTCMLQYHISHNQMNNKN